MITHVLLKYCVLPLRVGSESTDLHLPGRHCPYRIYHDGQEGLLVLLVQHLCGAINTREPAAIPRVAVVPAHHILQATH
jgi:hypothetical protein